MRTSHFASLSVIVVCGVLAADSAGRSCARASGSDKAPTTNPKQPATAKSAPAFPGAKAAPAVAGANTAQSAVGGKAAPRSGSRTFDLSILPADPAFDRFVDVAQIGAAIQDLNAPALADAGLQLAEAERILLRTRQGGLTARSVLSKAARLAVRKGDKETLDRVTRAAEKSSDKELLIRVENIKKQATASAAAATTVSIAECTPEAFAALKRHWEEAVRAELLEHRARLRAAGRRLQKSPGVPSAKKEALKKHIVDMQSLLPQTQSAEARTLAKLAGANRVSIAGFSFPAPNIPTPKISLPNIPTPNIKLPNIPTPKIPLPKAPTVNIPTPNIPTPKLPSTISIPNPIKTSIPTVNIPTPKIPNIPVPNNSEAEYPERSTNR